MEMAQRHQFKAAVLCLGLIATFCSWAAQGAPRACTEQEAQAAEVSSTTATSWKTLHGQFRLYGHCDDGAIAEGFSDSVTRLLADHWGTVREVAPRIASDPAFGRFIVRHVDATVPPERLQRIARNVSERCPRNLKGFCRDVHGAAIQ
jgi:hypothetical protein